MTWQIDVQGSRGGFAYHFAFEAGPEPLAVIGPNGAGKTTLLRALIGAIRPRAGHIRLGGRALFEAGGPWVPPEARRLGYVPQGYGLFPHLTAAQNVAFGIDGDLARAQALLADLGIAHTADQRPVVLSGGERQRVALARALAIEPDALLLDEPLAALDVAARRETRQFLSDHLRATGRPTVVVTHDLRDVRALGGPVLVIEGGRVIQSGSLVALQAAPATDFVAEFVDAVPGATPGS